MENSCHSLIYVWYKVDIVRTSLHENLPYNKESVDRGHAVWIFLAEQLI